MVLISYSENMNSEILHQVVFLDDTWVFASVPESKIWNDDTNLLRGGGQHQVPGTFLSMLEHEVNLFVGQV